jgi:hypothetical protein
MADQAKTRLRRSLNKAVIATIVLAFASPLAQAQTSDWNGGVGDWNVITNWTPNGVPNSGTTSVLITGTSGTPSVVTLDNLSPVINNLTLDSGQDLYVAGSTITDAGQINVGVLGSTGRLYVDSSTVTLSGTGTLSLNDPNSYIIGASSNYNLVNQNSAITGQGYIYNLASFSNGGTVNANV